MYILKYRKSKVISTSPKKLVEMREHLDEDKFSFFPDEVLEIILGNLEEPNDIASISKASSVCERILMPSKPTWLFYKIFQFVQIYFSRQDVCNCRLVCTMWKNIVDEYLVNENDNIRQRQFTFAPTSASSIEGFCRVMSPHRNINLFPARAVSFGKLWDGRLMAGYWVHVLRFLGIFGDHILACHFDFQNCRMDLFVIILKQCLIHMKNLKKIKISWNFKDAVGKESKIPTELEIKFPFSKKKINVKLDQFLE